MNQSPKELASALRAEAETIREDAERRMAVLTSAAELLEGGAPSPASAPRRSLPDDGKPERSVINMIRSVLGKFNIAEPVGVPSLRDQIARKLTDANELAKFKRGFATALGLLKSRGETRLEMNDSISRTDKFVTVDVFAPVEHPAEQIADPALALKPQP